MSAALLYGKFVIGTAASQEDFIFKVVFQIGQEMKAKGLLPDRVVKTYIAREYSDDDRFYFYTNNQFYCAKVEYDRMITYSTVEYHLYRAFVEKKEEISFQEKTSR